MKFTIDINENKIFINEPFTKKELDNLINIINIDGIEDWKIYIVEENQISKNINDLGITINNTKPNYKTWDDPYRYHIPNIYSYSTSS